MRKPTLRITTLLSVAAAVVVCAAPAHAAPGLPGIATVNAVESNGNYSDVRYSGGPVTGNHLVARVTPDGQLLSFDAAATLMVPSSVPETALLDDINRACNNVPELGLGDCIPLYAFLVKSDACTYGLGHTTCVATGRRGLCGALVEGNVGPDVITVRGSCFFVNGEQGNDVIDARDGAPSTILCGPGYDVATVDAVDVAGGDCEVVHRS